MNKIITLVFQMIEFDPNSMAFEQQEGTMEIEDEEEASDDEFDDSDEEYMDIAD
jgi:hypothetical protein